MTKKPLNPWETEPDLVWIVEEELIKPSEYFLKWWQDISITRFGDSSHWLDIAIELGYVVKEINPKSGQVIYMPKGFDFDLALVRNTLGLSPDLPIIRYKESGQEAYQQMWDMLNDNGGK